jgi:multidrug efflux system membrane fusion protein
VKQGDVLFEVDNRPFMIAVEKAQAEVLHAEALRDQAAIELKQAIENLKRNVVAADAVSFSQNALRAAEAEVRSAKASLDMARLDLEWTKIVAPIDGVLGDFSTIPGSAVAENDTVLTSLTDPSRLNVTFHVGEGSIHAIRKRRGAVALRVEVATAGDDSPIKGRVTYAGSSLDPKTRTCLIRAELENPDRSVMPGMSARVYLFTGERHEAILVNQNAVTFGNTSTIIYTCGEDKRIVPEAITVVVTRAGLVEITSRFDRSSWVVVEAGRDGSAYKLTLYLMGPGKPFERREVAMPEPKPKP